MKQQVVNHPVENKGFIGKSMAFIGKVVGLLFISAVCSVLLEWIGMTWWWPEMGHQHAYGMMQQEISYLGGSRSDDHNDTAIDGASGLIRSVIETVFIDSGAVDSIASLKTVDSDDSKVTRLIKSVLGAYSDYLMAAVFIFIMFMVRISILLLSLPAFILFGAVGLSDGLVQRDLRRWCGGHESSYVYHWAKRFALPTLVVTWFIYLTIPNSIHPNIIIMPFAVLFGCVLMVMSSRFKKYL